jgi:hypothetical protein
MESILALTGLALTSAFSFGVALVLGWSALAGLLRLLPASAPAMTKVTPIRHAGRLPAAPRVNQRARVVVTEARNRSGKMYTVRTT